VFDGANGSELAEVEELAGLYGSGGVCGGSGGKPSGGITGIAVGVRKVAATSGAGGRV